MHKSKTQQRFPNTLKYKGLLYLPPFLRNSNAKLWSQFDHPFVGYGRPEGSKTVPTEIVAPHSYSTFIHTTGLSYLAPFWRNAHLIQTDGQIYTVVVAIGANCDLRFA